MLFSTENKCRPGSITEAQLLPQSIRVDLRIAPQQSQIVRNRMHAGFVREISTTAADICPWLRNPISRPMHGSQKALPACRSRKSSILSRTVGPLIKNIAGDCAAERAQVFGPQRVCAMILPLRQLNAIFRARKPYGRGTAASPSGVIAGVASLRNR